MYDTYPPVSDLSVLLPWSNRIRRLIVLDASVNAVSPLNNFENLQELSLAPCVGVSGHIEFSRLPRLRDLTIEGYVDFSIADSQIEVIAVESARARNVREIEQLHGLRSIRLHAPRRQLAKVPSTTRTLELSGGRLTENTPIAGLAGLKELALIGIRGLQDLSAFSEARHLEALYLEDCRDVSSLVGPILSPGSEPVIVGKNNLRPTS